MRFAQGDTVEVQNVQTGAWMPGGKVVAVWSEVEIPSGNRRVTYDVDGVDEYGAYYGRWDEGHIRKAVLQ